MSSLPTLSKERLLIFGDKFAYSLSDDRSFAQTEYKVIHNEKSLNVVPVIKIRFNEQRLLFFMPSGIPLKKLQNSIGIHEYCIVMSSMLDEIKKIQNNGFLNIKNIDLSLNRIFVNSENYRVALSYVPSTEHVYLDLMDFNKSLKHLCLQILSENPALQNKEGLAIRETIKQSKGDVDSLYEIMSTAEEAGFNLDPYHEGRDEFHQEVLLKSVDGAIPINFRINTDRFVLGRKPELVNGLISCSPLIGRVHAVITKSNGQFYLSDLKSKNGTYLNNTKVIRPTLIRNGDVIRLGNVKLRAQLV